MNLAQLTSIEDIGRFLNCSQSVIYAVDAYKDERYKWIQTTLIYRSVNGMLFLMTNGSDSSDR